MEGNTSPANEEDVCIITIGETSKLLNPNLTNEWNKSYSRQMHKVLPQLRPTGLQGERLYDPVLVSLGPYHHGKEKLRQAEEFKYRCLHWCASGSEEKKNIFYNAVYKEIGEFRGSYAGVTTVYDDKTLTKMMLMDACFILNFMVNLTNSTGHNISEWRYFQGEAGSYRYAIRDTVLLENQIPFRVLKLLISLRYQLKEEGEKLVLNFLSWVTSPLVEVTEIPGEVEEPPLHLLEAYWRVIVQGQQDRINLDDHQEKLLLVPLSYHACRSVTDLKAKGICITPSSSLSLKDIKFKSQAFKGHLRLPVRYVSDQTQVVLSNLIAYEMSPGTRTDFAVLSYANFMKSLIETPDDVKELQENGVLFNRFANHEQAVNLFKGIDTFGLVNLDTFSDVRNRVEKHCRSKHKTWMADLIHTRFKTPWSVFAFLAAVLLLCLTSLQRFFTVFPRK